MRESFFIRDSGGSAEYEEVTPEAMIVPKRCRSVARIIIPNMMEEWPLRKTRCMKCLKTTPP